MLCTQFHPIKISTFSTSLKTLMNIEQATLKNACENASSRHKIPTVSINPEHLQYHNIRHTVFAYDNLPAMLDNSFHEG